MRLPIIASWAIKAIIIPMIMCYGAIIVHADTKELDKQMIIAINKIRMTKSERIQVNRFIRKYKREVKESIDVQKIVLAVNKITQKTRYLKYKHNPSDVLAGYADCQGYSIMFFMLMQRVNIECQIVYNSVHMWNRIYMNGKWVDIDITALDKFIDESEGVNDV